MKKLFFTTLLFYSFIAHCVSQAVIADPAVNVMRTTSQNTVPLDPFQIPMGVVFQLKVPVINYNLINALPTGSCKIKIGLGTNVELDPAFNLSTVNTSNYFQWTSEFFGGQIQITGELIAPLPKNFADTAVFQLKGFILGSSTVTTNFLVTNHNTTVNLSDENGANNNTALQYVVVENTGGPLPVTFTNLTSLRELCSIKVDFKTENEVNVDRFEIEVSKNGLNYEKVGTLTAGNLGNYKFKFDITSALTSANLFVRIKSIDIDGQFQYSSVSKVSGICAESENNIIIFPNPAPNGISYFTIRNESGLFKGTYYISITDISGRMVNRRKIVLLNEKQFIYQYGLLPTGEYIVQILKENGEQLHTTKWQKL